MPYPLRSLSPRAWRIAAGGLLTSLGLSLALFSISTGGVSAAGSGVLSPTNPSLSYNGGPFAASNPTSPTGDTPPVCTTTTPCDQYALKITIPAGDTTAYKATVTIGWTNAPGGVSDFDVYVYKSDGVTQVARAGSSKNPETLSFKAVTGDYNVIVVPYSVQPTVTFTGGIALTVGTVGGPNPTPAPAAGAPSFANYIPPSGLGGDAGEPSIGVNWKTGRVLFQANLQTLRVTFNDCTSPARALWVNKPGPVTSTTTLDPILFTDHDTGRTFVSQLAGKDSLTNFTDNDGDTYSPSEGGSAGTSGVDHQTFGGGPFVPGAPDGTGTYPNTVYYASQDIGDATAAISRDGGVTFGPGVPMYTIGQCGGLHGHIKVAPDGTVYVPNKGCNDLGGSPLSRQYQAVAVSENEGTTWTVRKVPTSKPGGSDPSVGVALNKPPGQASNTIYFGYVNADGHPHVAVSRDRGLTWTDDQDVGTAFGTVNTVFPAVVAGDDGRAAFAYHGTSTPGPSTGQDPSAFIGEWNLYVATTYDGGKTWLTVDATPQDPVQRSVICTAGTTCATGTRNLLDFMDVALDKQGRVLVGYADGCIGPCVAGGSNSGTARATIARQSSGRTLFAANDPAGALLPSSPLVTATLNPPSTVRLTWAAPADGGSAITSYNIYRGSDGVVETVIANVPSTARSYDDPAGSAGSFYYVTAINTVGESSKCDKVVPTAAAAIPDPCTLPGSKVVDDGNGDQLGAPNNKDLDIQSISIAEPFFADNSTKLIFTLKVADLSTVPADRQYRIIWTPKTPPSSTDDRYYVGMTSTAPGTVNYEYGTVSSSGNVPVTKGAADSGSFTADGTIRITLAASKIGNPKAGETLASLSGRTFAGSGTGTVTKTSAADSTADSAYAVVGNASCANPTPAPSPTPTVPPTAIQLANISGRVLTQSGDRVGIGGFIVSGNQAKRVLVRGIGPSINVNGQPVSGRISDPTVELFDREGRIGFNDNWREGGQQDEIAATGLAPQDSRESAIVARLQPGLYTGIVRGANEEGVGLVEVYDLEPANGELGNLSVRANVQTGDNILIAGLIIANGTPQRVLVRSIGPELNGRVAGALQDPQLELHDGNGATLIANDNWRSAPNATDIAATGLAPADDREPAAMMTLGPGLYTSVVRGTNNTTGVATSEAYKVGN